MAYVYPTTLIVALPGGGEAEMGVLIEYSRTEGYAATMEEPGCEAGVTIDDVHLADGARKGARLTFLISELESDDELKSALMGHWADEDEAAQERRHEDRRERMLELD